MNRNNKLLKKVLKIAPKTVISSTLLAAMIATAWSGAASANQAPSAKVVLTTNKTSYSPGEEITVTVQLKDIQNVDPYGLWAQSFAVVYDGSIFSNVTYTTVNGSAREYIPSGYSTGSLLSDSSKYDFFTPTDVSSTDNSEVPQGMHEVRFTVMDKTAGMNPIQPQDQTLATFKLRVNANAPKGNVELGFRESFSLMVGNNDGDPDPQYSYDTERISETPVTIEITDPASNNSSSNTYIPVVTPANPDKPAEPATTSSKDVFQSKVVNNEQLVSSIVTRIDEAKKSTAPVPAADIRNHWAENNIQTFVKLNIVQGYEDGTMKPDANITRAEFAAMITRVFNVAGDSKATVPLKDVDKHWAKDAIQALANAGVINGYGDGSFRPNKTISREEMVAIIMRLINIDQVSKDETKGHFTDTTKSFAADSIEQAAEAGIINGKTEGKFDPKSNSTRAEAISVILNTLKLNPEIKTLLESLNS